MVQPLARQLRTVQAPARRAMRVLRARLRQHKQLVARVCNVLAVSLLWFILFSLGDVERAQHDPRFFSFSVIHSA